MAAFLNGCPASGSDYTTGSSGGHASSGRATAAATGVSSTSSGISTGTTSGSTGTTTGGTSGTTGAVGFPPCMDGGVQITGSIVQFPSGDALDVPLTVDNRLDTTQVANTDQHGNYSFCVPPGTPLAPEIVAVGNSQVILETLNPTQDEQVPPVPALPSGYAMSNLGLGACSTQNAEDAIIAVQINPTTWDWFVASTIGGDPPDCTNRENWTFALTDSNGKPLDAGFAYAIGDQACGGASTDSIGVGFAEIAPPFTTVGVIATRGNNVLPDGGLLCNNVGSDPHFAFTGQAALASGAITFLPVMLRAASFSAPGVPAGPIQTVRG